MPEVHKVVGFAVVTLFGLLWFWPLTAWVLGRIRRVHGDWSRLQTGTSSRLRAALAGSRLYLAGDSGTLLTSLDNGAHWSPIDLATRADFYGLEDL